MGCGVRSGRSPSERYFAKIRSAAVPLAIIGAIVILCVSVHAHYPIQKWLFWTDARSSLCASYFAIACMSAGRLALRHLFRLQLAADERLIFSFWTGVLAFFLAMF